MIRWTGLAPWEFEFLFPGSLISAFLVDVNLMAAADSVRKLVKCPVGTNNPNGHF